MRENASNFHPRRLIQGLLLKPFNYLRLEWAPQYTSVASRMVANIRKTRRAAIVKICLLQGGHPGERRADGSAGNGELDRRPAPFRVKAYEPTQWIWVPSFPCLFQETGWRAGMSTEVSCYGWPSCELGQREEPPRPIHITELLRNSHRVYKKLLEAEPVWMWTPCFIITKNNNILNEKQKENTSGSLHTAQTHFSSVS